MITSTTVTPGHQRTRSLLAAIAALALLLTGCSDSGDESGTQPYTESPAENKLVAGDCGVKGHDHSKTTLASFPIAHALVFRNAEACILDIAATHGAESGRKAQVVLNKYVYGQMKRDELIVQSPLADMDIDVGTVKTTNKTSNDVAMGEADYDRLVDYLLALDPAEGIEKPKRGVYTVEDRIAQRATVIDLTLLQMTTGIRLGSARQIEPFEILDNSQGGVNVFVPRAKLKGGERRNKHNKVFTILDDRVAERFRQRRRVTAKGEYVLGSPAKPTVPWDRRNVTREIEALYVELADELGIEELREDIRSHGWRTTLNTVYRELPPHVRAAWFGHSEAVNAAHYVDDTADPSPMVAAAKRRRLRVVGD